ncbi:MAG: phosphotransferase [Phycisphaeraceae bacterium]|nr:phosphotransferase [Phycisphaeraceae bacterium]
MTSPEPDRVLASAVLFHALRHQGPGAEPTIAADRFTREELLEVLSHYPLGAPASAHPLYRGSLSAPKVVVELSGRRYLLKRREPDQSNPFHVAMCHAVMLALADAGFGVPNIIGTSLDNNSMLQLHGRVYELVEFVEGRVDGGSPTDARLAGDTLARLHSALKQTRIPFAAPEGSYHRAESVERRLVEIERRHAECKPGAARLRALYAESGARANAAGIERATRHLIHGDWHPGNVLFDADGGATVVDFDSVCLAPGVVDLAGGALQWSILPPPPDRPIEQWPVGLSRDRLRAFLDGYRTGGAASWDLPTLAPLMIEAVIAEAAGPVARTGSFGSIPGRAFLGLIERHAAWILEHEADLAATP